MRPDRPVIVGEEDEARRCLIVFDGKAWFVRQVRLIEHNLTDNEKVYHCDQPIGGPYDNILKACAVAKQWIEGP